PYPTQAVPTGSTSMLAAQANDSPSLGSGRLGSLAFTEDLINTMEIRDVFQMFLLLRLQGGARRTLHAAIWTFVGLARSSTTALGPVNNPTGTLSLDTSVSRIIPTRGSGTASSQAPVLSPNVTTAPFQPDRAGLSGNQTFADLFLPILQGRGRRPTSTVTTSS
ncbi:MAG: hypothetical protein ACREUU_16645, partial [Gammaproteobacteria bacterium]